MGPISSPTQTICLLVVSGEYWKIREAFWPEIFSNFVSRYTNLTSYPSISGRIFVVCVPVGPWVNTSAAPSVRAKTGT